MTIGIGLAGAHSNGLCPLHVDYILAGDGVMAGTVYHRDYDNGGVTGGDNGPLEMAGSDWIYTETGVKPGIQSGNNHAVLGASWGHEHNCYHSVAAERDLLWY